jgi:general secretion pathway protein E
MQDYPDIKSEQVQKNLSDSFSDIYENYPAKISCSERKKIDWELCEKGRLPEAELLSVYSKITGFPSKEEDELVSLQPYPYLSFEYLENNCCIPFRHTDSELEMLISDPYTIDSIVYLFKRFYNVNITFTLVRRSIIERLVQKTYNSDETKNLDNEHVASFENPKAEEALRSLAGEAKIVRLVNEFFSRAVEMDASDIHVEPEENKYIVRFRVDGILQEYLSASSSQYPAVASRIKLIGGLNIAESRLPQDGRTNIQLGKRNIDIRISTIPILNGESIVLRLLRKDSTNFSLTSTGMSDNLRAEFEKIIHKPHGIILVVGPTGSGKTTTLYSVMSQLNTPGKKIITIEDPVEYRIPRLSQMQVNSKIGLNFANGLRNIVRQDPDIILVGEIRDKETADIAINAALTGHLVLSTLHTNDAASAISRLQDMGMEGFLISSSIIGILSQRLIRTVCKKCNGLDETASGEKCKECGGSGFKGRTGIFELLVIDNNIRAAILKNFDSSTINAIAIKSGMIPLIEDGKNKVAAGITTKTEVLRAASDI